MPVAFRAGQLRQIITIQKQGPFDSFGQPSAEWATEVDNVPALVEPLSGLKTGADRFWDPRAGNTQMIPTDTHRVTIRYWTDSGNKPLDATRRIIFEGRVLSITSVTDYESRRIYMVLSCQERTGVTS